MSETQYTIRKSGWDFLRIECIVKSRCHVPEWGQNEC